jgi:signal transduction histidine kinase
MMIIVIYLVENPNLRTKKNISFILTFFFLSLFFMGNYLYFSFERHLMFDYPLVEGFFDFIVSSSVFASLICYILFLFLESGDKKLTYLMILIVGSFIIVGVIGVGLILITTGVEESLYFYLLAFTGTLTGSFFGTITLSKSIRERLFPVQDRLLMRRRNLKYIGEGMIFLSIGSFTHLLVDIFPEIMIIAIILMGISVFLFFISMTKTREHLREVSVRIIDSQLEELKAVDKLKTQIIDVSSHEMRTPIAVIKGHFELLAKDENEKQLTPEFRKNSFNAIERNIERIERSLTSIYDFSDIRRDLFDFQFENSNLVKVIDNTVNDMRDLITQKGLNISFDVKLTHANPHILIDPVRISQVIRNLLENAIKYSLEGEITVNLAETKNEYIVSVADQGIGIDKERMKTLFDPFKDQNQSTIDVKGLGLGLYISKNIIERHNGRIWVISDEKGSQFFFSLPKNINQEKSRSSK